MVDSDAEELRQCVRDMARAQADFYGVVYVELSAIKENTARTSERLEGVNLRIDSMVSEGAKLAAVVAVLEAAENRRIDRARIVVMGGKLLAWSLATVGAWLAVHKAIAHWGTP